jgi:hypothetical protein
MRIVGFKGLAQVVDNNTAWAAPIKRFENQLREARVADPLPPLLRMMDEIRQRATHDAQQPSSSQHDSELVQLMSTDVVTDDGVEDVKPVKPAKRTRKRKPTLAAVARQVGKAGIPVTGYEVRSDGSIRIITSKSKLSGEIEMDDTTPIDQSEWN